MLSTLQKINSILKKRQRKGVIIISILLFFGMFLEIFGLGILFPTISILLDPELINETPILNTLRTEFQQYSDNIFLVLCLASVIVLYIIRFIYLIFLSFFQNKILSNISSLISNHLFTYYLNQPFSFHQKNNSSRLIKNIQVEINHFNAFLLSILTITIEGCFMFSILLTLIYFEPMGAFVLGIFYSIFSFLFYRLTRSKLKYWGIKRQELDSQLSKITHESFGGIKDLIIRGKVYFFTKKFIERNHDKARLNTFKGTLSQIPRYYLELISIIGLVLFITVMIFLNKNINELITVLGIFVAASFKLIPSFNKIISANQTIKYYKESVTVIFNETSKASNFSTNKHDKGELKINFKDKILFKDVCFGYKEEKLILEGLNLEINKGQKIGIKGKSGTGKSTLVDLIVGLQEPSSGSISIDGKKDIQFKEKWRNSIGYFSQHTFLWDDTIKNNIALGVEEDNLKIDYIKSIITQLNLDGPENKINIDSIVGEKGIQLSGGQKQRVGIGRILYNKPDIIILDEPTSALDQDTEKIVMNFIDNLNKDLTLIIVSHNKQTLDYCDLIYELKNKKLYKLEK